MKLKWIKEDQSTGWGLIRTGDEVDIAKRGIPNWVALDWVKDGWAVVVKPIRKISKKGGKK